uniref:HU family DNA-binding protein n=1 Tax=Streptomyces brasiliscabiei TaxID=2736302 RepID=UPI001C11FA5E
MNRSELVAARGDRAEVTSKDSDAVLAAFAEVVGDIVAKGEEKVTIPGFLTFERTLRADRTARNPQTGDPIQIPAGY